MELNEKDIHFEFDGKKGAFFIQHGGPRLGQMVFKAGDHLIIIEHTDVSDRLRGTGAGKKLLAATVDYARKNNFKIVPVCPLLRH